MLHLLFNEVVLWWVTIHLIIQSLDVIISLRSAENFHDLKGNSCFLLLALNEIKPEISDKYFSKRKSSHIHALCLYEQFCFNHCRN